MLLLNYILWSKKHVWHYVWLSIRSRAGIHKTCWDQILSQVLGFDLKSETVFGLKFVAIHKIVETNFSLRFGLKLKTGT